MEPGVEVDLDRRLAAEHLLQAEGFVRLGRNHIALQTNIIGRLEQLGLDPAAARRLLATHLDMQKLHEAHRDWLCEELGQELGEAP